ncbi:1781_t:CDS:2, partial [Acaulospora colombiana]
IATLANTSESLVFIILSLLVIHLWFIIKESNPIFNTEERSRKIEISLAVPSSRTVSTSDFPITENVLFSSDTDDTNEPVTNIESEEAIRSEEREMRRIESENAERTPGNRHFRNVILEFLTVMDLLRDVVEAFITSCLRVVDDVLTRMYNFLPNEAYKTFLV